ncbi:MAG: Sensor histidine kinase RcsC [Chroococcopsis gigantea SAG 12.99]|nr:ATP-binding protein [Chlorogloea purpurea SAG 13.99]MDV3002297.1 Sensor histidine kinase RcsC [Chroococcopsis gigantea SAG 12.99]
MRPTPSPDNREFLALHKLLFEIISNAFKFSESGTPVEVEGVAEGDRYRLTVRDYGRGMTEEQCDNMGAFVQFDRNRYEQQGLGLGLAIVKRLVEIYRGEITISSGGLGQGTCVTVFFLCVVQIV